MPSKKHPAPVDMDDMDDFLNLLEGEVKSKKQKSDSSFSAIPTAHSSNLNSHRGSTEEVQHIEYQEQYRYQDNETHDIVQRSVSPMITTNDHKEAFDVTNSPHELTEQSDPPRESRSNRQFISSAELIGLESAAKNLQAAIFKILDEAPKYSDLHSYDSDDPKVLKSKYFILTSKLKEAAAENNLKVLNDIAEFSENSIFVDDTGLKSEIKESIDYVIFDSNNNQMVTSNINYDDYTDYIPPPLPVIKDDHLYDQVFFHKSLEVTEVPEYITESNERLIFLGESVMSNIVTRIFYRRFPELKHDYLLNERRELLSSSNLTKWSCLYSLDQQVNNLVPHLKTKLKIYGECFYAYIGALSLQFGDDIVVIKKWLEALVEPAIEQLNLVEPIRKSAKGELNLLIGSQRCSPSYHTIQIGSIVNRQFAVECCLGNEVLAVGKANNVKDAGIRAAMIVLNNPSLLEKFSRKSRIKPLTGPKQLMIEDGSSLSYASHHDNDSSQLLSVIRGTNEGGNIELPIIASSIDPSKIDLLSKDKLYSILLRNRHIPVYETEKLDDANMKVTLSVDKVPLVIAIERNKKLSSQRAAMELLNNIGILKSHRFI